MAYCQRESKDGGFEVLFQVVALIVVPGDQLDLLLRLLVRQRVSDGLLRPQLLASKSQKFSTW